MPKKRFTLNTSQTELLVTPKAGSSASLSVKVAPPPSRCSSPTIGFLFLPQRAHNPKRNTSELTSKISYMQNTATASCVRCEHPHPSHYHPQSSALTSAPRGLPAPHPTRRCLGSPELGSQGDPAESRQVALLLYSESSSGFPPHSR